MTLASADTAIRHRSDRHPAAGISNEEGRVVSKDTARGGGNPTRSRRRSESDTPGAVSGSLTPWAFMLGAVAIFMTGWNLAQFARRVPSAGSYVGFAFHGGNAVRPGLGRHAAACIFYLSLLSAPV